MNLLAAFLYLAALVALGIWGLKRTRDARDFFLAGGRIGFIPAVMATLASIMSGFVFVGGPGLFYDVGLGSFWITISSSFTGALMCWLLARPLSRMAQEAGCLTIPDVILARYGCRFSSGAAAAGILAGVIGYLSTQLMALGVILAPMLGVAFPTAIWIGCGVLFFYSVAGGMKAGIYSDVLQGAIMLWAATLVFFYALQSGGGLAELSQTILDGQPEHLHPWGAIGAFGALSWFFVFAVGSMGQPHVIHKFMMVGSLRSLRLFPLALAVGMVLCGLIWLGVGLAVKGLVLKGEISPLETPDDAINVFLGGFVPAWLMALTYAGILAAIMSTADSFVNIGAAALTRDLPKALGANVANEVLRGRIYSALLFLIAWGFADGMGTLVAYLGIFGFSAFAATLTPSLAIGLNWPSAGKWAARLSIAVGLTATILLELSSRIGIYSPSLSPGALALVLSMLVFLVFGHSCAQLRSRFLTNEVDNSQQHATPQQ